MRSMMSWLSMLSFSVIAQIHTFVFCGLACGYAFGVYAYLKLMRYLTARWNVTTAEPPFTMISKTVSEPQLSFRS